MSSQPETAVEDSKYDVRFLDPADIRLFRVTPDDTVVRMLYRDELCWREVRIAHAMPLSDPDHYIGLRDGADKEIGMLADLKSIDSQSLQIIQAELARRYFLPKVQSVTYVQDQFGVVVWDVETDFGPRRYTVRNMRDNTVPLPDGRVLMTDTDGNRFEFPNIEGLDPRSLEVLTKVV